MRTFYAILAIEVALWVSGFAEKLTGVSYEVPDHGFIWSALFLGAFFALILQDYKDITRKNTMITFNNHHADKKLHD